MPITKEHKSLLRKLYDVDQIPRHIQTIANLEKEFFLNGAVNVSVLFRAGEVIQGLRVKECVSDVLYEMLKLISQVDWEKDVLWDNTDKGKTPRVVLSNLYYDSDTKKRNFDLWMKTFIEGIGSLEDFYQKYLSDFIPSFEMFQSLVGKAKKGTLVYTDIPLIQKLESAPKVNLHQRPETSKDEDIDKVVNIDDFIHKPNSQDYIFGRLKRDAELGDEKAIEVVGKVKRGEFKSARQVALEMGYRKPVKQKCLPMDVEKAVDKILKQMGDVYADELCTALYQRLREIHLQNSED